MAVATERGEDDGYLKLSRSQPLHYFERDDDLIHYFSHGMKHPLRICAIDAEWPPSTSETRGKEGPKAASLAQLAIRDDADRNHVLVVDLYAISKACIKRYILTLLFHDSSIVKVGYGLWADVRAILLASKSPEDSGKIAERVGYSLSSERAALALQTFLTPSDKQRLKLVNAQLLDACVRLETGRDTSMYPKEYVASLVKRNVLDILLERAEKGALSPICLVSHNNPEKQERERERERRSELTSTDMFKCDEWVDLAVLHGKAINPRGTSLGLKDLTSCLLGCAMSKELQCSAWGERPLSRAQLEYAALDAACLLDIFDKVVNRLVLKTHLKDPKKKKEKLSALECARELAVIKRKKKGGGGNVREMSKAKRDLERKKKKQREEKERGKAVDDVIAAWEEEERPLSDEESAKASLESLKQSVSGWFNKFDRPKFVCDEMLEGLAKQLRSLGVDADSVTSNQHMALLARSKELGKQDSRGEYWKRVRETQRHIRELLAKEMVEKHDDEGRVILTQDQKFANRGLADRLLVVSPRGKREQLKHVVEIFQLDIQDDNLFTRCIKCNGEFQRIPRKLVQAAVRLKAWQDERTEEIWGCSIAHDGQRSMLEVITTIYDTFGGSSSNNTGYPELGLSPSEEIVCREMIAQVPRGLIEKQQEFWHCLGCQKIYWEGIRYETALSCLKTQLIDCKIK